MPRQAKTIPVRAGAVESQAQRRVLLVEPDQIMAGILKRRLADAHAATVDTVPTVRRMQEQLARRPYQLVLVDMSLNVAPILAQIKERAVAVVVTTPGASPQDVHEHMTSGADAVLITSLHTPEGVVTLLRKFL